MLATEDAMTFTDSSIDPDSRYCVQITFADDNGDVQDAIGTDYFRLLRDAKKYANQLLRENANHLPASSKLDKPEVDQWGQTTILARNGNCELEIISYV